MQQHRNGFTLIEMLVSLLAVSLIMAGIISNFVAQDKAGVQGDRLRATEENLRAGMDIITDALRNSGFGVPNGNLGTWINWVAGFNTSPVVITGNGPQTLSLAACTSQPVATLTAAANAGATQLTVNSTATLATGNLIWIAYREFARVQAMTNTTITIDTNPNTSSVNDGLGGARAAGSPICRVEVLTFAVNTSSNTLSMTRSSASTGTTTSTLAEGISDLQVTSVTAGRKYQITLTGVALDTKTHAPIYRSLTSGVALMN
jgi:prepilin-type N-terminal cleavage/methylation domain-containing protein